MAQTASQLVATLNNLDAEIKTLKDEQNLLIEKFAAASNLTVPGVKKGIKEYRAFVKDQGGYTIADAEASKFLEEAAKK